jgi:SpoVK/Ycf46/Vps4 family AAA+-type ATPase
MTAAVLAREFGKALYRVDLSSVVSKYIGETEKNLHRVFQEAEFAQAIILFDEATASSASEPRCARRWTATPTWK